MSNDWMDISVPIHTGMAHWPDNPPVLVEYMLHMERGDICTVSTLSMGSHTGTHMDGPFHFLPEGPGLHEMPLDAAIGRARVIEIQRPRVDQASRTSISQHPARRTIAFQDVEFYSLLEDRYLC